MTCPICGSVLHITTEGKVCQNCGWKSIGSTRWVSTNSTALPLTKPDLEGFIPAPIYISSGTSETISLTDIKDLITRVSALETELERFNFNNESLKKRCADLATDISLINHEMSNLKKLLNARCENLLDQIHDEKDKVRYIYIIRERTREFTASSDWDIVGNVCYLTFKDANEKMKQLIKDYRQSDPDYNVNNLNIIQVKVRE